MSRSWLIYTLSDPRTGKVRYVGMTFRRRRRFNEHISRALKGGVTHRDRWIRSLLAVDLKPLIAIVQEGRGDNWQEAERSWIARLRKTCRLVNHTDGGDGTPGYVPTPALRRRWSEIRRGVKYAPGRIPAMKGRHHTLKTRERIAAAGTGRRHTPESRAKISAAHTGKVLSREHRELLSAAKRGRTLSAEHRRRIALSTTGRKPVVCVETGEVFASIADASRILGVTKASVNQAIHKGFRCRGNHLRFA